MTLPKILVQLDTDALASVFDAVVAVDSGVDQLLQYAAVRSDQVRDLVYGTIFTRSSDQLHNTAVFIGGRDVEAGEALLASVTKTFFGPMRVSVMLDANGANTTAAAAVIAAQAHMELRGSRAVVLAGTGSVGRRVCQLLAQAGAEVMVASRVEQRAIEACKSIRRRVPDASIHGVMIDSRAAASQALGDAQLVVAAGAPGVNLLSSDVWQQHRGTLRAAIDLNAVPPLGIDGIQVQDRGVDHHGTAVYGAIGVGGIKMKIHRAAIRQLFVSNDQVLDAAEIYQLGLRLP